MVNNSEKSDQRCRREKNGGGDNKFRVDGDGGRIDDCGAFATGSNPWEFGREAMHVPV